MTRNSSRDLWYSNDDHTDILYVWFQDRDVHIELLDYNLRLIVSEKKAVDSIHRFSSVKITSSTRSSLLQEIEND